MKYIIKESHLESIIFYLNNNKDIMTEEVIQGSGSDPWEYKKQGKNYYARKKDNPNGSWQKVRGTVKVAIAKRVFDDKVSASDPDISKSDLYFSFFHNQKQGNMFRKWVKRWYPEIANEFDLDWTGPFDNLTIKMVAAQKVKTKKGTTNLGTLFFRENKNAYLQSDESGKTLHSLIKTGFKINRDRWSSEEGYYVDKCTQEGCAQYTYDMIGDKFGDAWQAYQDFDAYAKVSPETVKKMEKLFTSINKKGAPALNAQTSDDETAKNILISLIPNQNQFKKLKLGDVVGLYYPDSNNYDLAFFQSAIGKFRDAGGNWYSLRPPYFCTDPKNYASTKWKISDIGSDKVFKAGPTLSSGKSFMPNTHLGFIGYIDEEGVPYVVHNVHKTVYAYPVTKMIPGQTLSIVWAGTPIK